MKLNDEIVIAMIDGQKKILVVDKNTMKNYKTHNVDAYDLYGDAYTLDCDLAGYNGFKKAIYFDYYLNDELLKPLYTDEKLMLEEKLIKNAEISLEKLKHIESVLNKKTDEATY